VPINFWHADQPLERVGSRQLAWRSVTTGGVAGLIVTLEKDSGGSLEMKTLQGEIGCEIGSISLDPSAWECGGLRKRIEISRLPDEPPSHSFSFSLPLTGLRRGDNPIFIRVTQEDGHMAWTSPVFLVWNG
jgi:hypothetical protein